MAKPTVWGVHAPFATHRVRHPEYRMIEVTV